MLQYPPRRMMVLLPLFAALLLVITPSQATPGSPGSSDVAGNSDASAAPDNPAAAAVEQERNNARLQHQVEQLTADLAQAQVRIAELQADLRHAHHRLVRMENSLATLQRGMEVLLAEREARQHQAAPAHDDDPQQAPETADHDADSPQTPPRSADQPAPDHDRYRGLSERERRELEWREDRERRARELHESRLRQRQEQEQAERMQPRWRVTWELGFIEAGTNKTTFLRSDAEGNIIFHDSEYPAIDRSQVIVRGTFENESDVAYRYTFDFVASRSGLFGGNILGRSRYQTPVLAPGQLHRYEFQMTVTDTYRIRRAYVENIRADLADAPPEQAPDPSPGHGPRDRPDR